MNRRGFFGMLAAPFIARLLPSLPWKRRTPTIGAINSASYTFWRNQQLVRASDGLLTLETLQVAYDNCTRSHEATGANIRLEWFNV